MIVFGLTGKTGAGKSTVAALLENLGFLIIDGDKVAREITQGQSEVVKKLSEAFGNQILLDDGTLNRRALAKIAFSSEENTKLLNSITHTAIDNIFKARLAEGEKEGFKYALIDAAALLESPSIKLCNKLIVVHATTETRLQRILSRDNISLDEAMRRINAQKDDNYYLDKADFVFFNEDNEFEKSMAQLKEYISSL